MRILVFGDSHQGVWELVAKDLVNHTMDILAVDAATAYGIMHNDSESKARSKFFDHIDNHDPYDVILVGLGEVDCGYRIWKNKENHVRSASALLRFLHEISLFYKDPKVIFIAVNPPIVENAAITNPVYSNRTAVKASLSDRRKLTLDFNNAVTESWPNCISIWRHVLNPFTNKVFKRFKREDPQDHHLSWEATAWLWLDELAPYLEN